MSAFKSQVGGTHYTVMPIQPIEFCHRNGLGACETLVVRYVSRWKRKDGIKDLRKARHILDLLIEMEETEDTDAVQTQDRATGDAGLQQKTRGARAVPQNDRDRSGGGARKGSAQRHRRSGQRK